MSGHDRNPSPGVTRALAAAAIVVALSIVTDAARAGLTSTWRSTPVVVDGMRGDWTAAETLPRGPAVGAVNDDQFLHVMVSTSDPDLRDVLATGLILWFDPSGGKAQTFGVWVPGLTQRSLPGGNPPTTENPATGIIARTLDRFDLLGPGKNQRRLVDMTPDLGIELALGTQELAVIYELRIPLQKTAERLYAVGAPPGRTVGLGVATPEAPRDRSRRNQLVGSSGSIGGDWWRGGGFAPFRDPPEGSKPIEIWTTLTLAAR